MHVLLITGCSTGIGRALAKEAARLGHQVFATARRPEALADLASERLTPLPLDVTSEASVSTAVTTVIEQAGAVDVLINNAGVSMTGPLAEAPLERVRQTLETNVVGLLAVTQAVFPHMAERRRGRIINIGSVVGLLTTPYAGAYCASKAAVHALSESLRMECAPFGIDVVEVQPGGVRSQLAAGNLLDLDRYRNEQSFYRPFVAGIEKRAVASQQAPMDTDRFARVVLAQALARRAPRILRAGRGARALPALVKLPGPLRDRLLRQQFGLSTKD
ncbi:MAG: SDR family oxidoreductase [Myxococcales bacterium]|nr:SDR family oxidoreductase [Myxococcales bacterium]